MVTQVVAVIAVWTGRGCCQGSGQSKRNRTECNDFGPSLIERRFAITALRRRLSPCLSPKGEPTGKSTFRFLPRALSVGPIADVRATLAALMICAYRNT